MFTFPRRKPAQTDPHFEHSVAHSAANSSQAGEDIQREMVRLAFKDTLRATGVPAQWLDCAVRRVQSRRDGESVQVQLIVKKWSGLLLAHTLAFQRELEACLDRYEPHVDHALYDWAWKFADDCDTPYPRMPAPEEWAKKLEAAERKRQADKKALAPKLTTALGKQFSKEVGTVSKNVSAQPEKRALAGTVPHLTADASQAKPAKSVKGAPATQASAQAFGIRDIFSDLTAEQLKKK